ncbi:MAG: sulfur oxidation c-type cytochrome SoxX [Thiohalocapsa sp.]|jgi:sulfur-oxidizing protein SoxX|uniref:sulfur oxidation c-type cytochrome SoxX n=1 Tax=Thiohalocapsa sp. TaxID=2497641 RepID=UPI0025FBC891|nr:sulfur oxidation c-type cytochrome SoxX [Thiohalocapsa sp.]MCG6940163.1 sulfur oxidation c-type cytochrome SoxX [Thiohalocapsa sp.]
MPIKQPLLAVSAATLLTLASATALAEMPELNLSGNAEAGKEIAMDRSRGNCIACHVLPGGESPGAIGPALVAMQTRYSSKQDLAQQIWDPTIKNPDAVMPPFGKHGILSDKEFVDVVEYVWSL